MPYPSRPDERPAYAGMTVGFAKVSDGDIAFAGMVETESAKKPQIFRENVQVNLDFLDSDMLITDSCGTILYYWIPNPHHHEPQNAT